MKAFLNKILNNLLIFVISGILFTGVGVYATTQFLAKDISFKPQDERFSVTNVEDALNMLYSNNDGLNPDIIEKLWAPVGLSQNTFSGTYQFQENYKWVLVIWYTNSYVNTKYQVNNMELYKDMKLATRYSLGAIFNIYKDVGTDASIYFSINNLASASITVYGIK